MFYCSLPVENWQDFEKHFIGYSHFMDGNE